MCLSFLVLLLLRRLYRYANDLPPVSVGGHAPCTSFITSKRRSSACRGGLRPQQPRPDLLRRGGFLLADDCGGQGLGVAPAGPLVQRPLCGALGESESGQGGGGRGERNSPLPTTRSLVGRSFNHMHDTSFMSYSYTPHPWLILQPLKRQVENLHRRQAVDIERTMPLRKCLDGALTLSDVALFRLRVGSF